MNKVNKLPTASQSLYKWNFKLVHEDMAKCIDEHTRLHTAPLREELEKLRAENERLKKDISDYSSQVCDLQDEQETLNNENYGIMVKNQKLREALEKCKTILSCWDDTESVNKVVKIAKEALKGDDNV